MFRIIDANFNRLREGLRVIEDILRFYFSQKKFESFKNIRHKLKEIEKKCYIQGLMKRDSSLDLGNKKFSVEKQRSGLKDLTIANFKRAEESLRTLEEVFKITHLLKESDVIKNIRYKVYDLEKEVLTLFTKQFNLSLYLVTDSRYCNEKLENVVEQSILGGVSMVQLREKHLSDKQILKLGKKVKRVCHQNNIPFIIDDRIDLCLALDADGVHIGQNDIPVKIARDLLGPGKIIGKSTHSFAQAQKAVKEEIDYFAFGPLFKTPTKNYKPVFHNTIKDVLKLSKESDKPIVFIGGITSETIDEVINLNIKSIACVREIMAAPNPKKQAQFLKNKLKEVK